METNRQALLDDTGLTGSAWCRACTELVDAWVQLLFEEQVALRGDPDGIALLAVGGYGRAELCPHSDIDLVLVHGGCSDVADVASRIWYPIWDQGLKLGHAVRTPAEALSLAAADLDTATSLLSARHVAGDAELSAELAAAAATLWRKRSRRWLPEQAERVVARQRRAGEVAFLLEPNLKDGRGGLRDVQAIRWAEAADRVMFEGDDAALDDAYEVVLAARVELHRHAQRPGDVLLLQEQDAVAAALGDPDADALMARVAAAARTIAWRSDEVWDRLAATATGASRWRTARDRELAPGVIRRDGRVALRADADPAGDPALVLVVAAAAAEAGLRIERASLERLAAASAPPPDPWPAEALAALVDLLAAGHRALPVVESLDQVGLWVRLLPEWAPNRCRPQRNAYHRFTVDRHLWETAAEAATLADRVDRRDLLVLAAVLHDIGKGYPGDHTDVGVDLVGVIGARLGLSRSDVAVLQTLVREHLLLADTATRRDLADPATVELVAQRVGSVEVLELLAALTEADSRATGPAAWGSWKAELVADLVTRTALALGALDPATVQLPEFPTAEHLALLEAGTARVDGAEDRLTLVVPDRTGLFNRVAGVLALHGLEVLDAAAYTHTNGMALETFRVESPAGPVIAWDRVLADLADTLAGRLALPARLAERARTYARPPRAAELLAAPPSVRIDNSSSASATVLEVQAPDAIGLLYRITGALAELDLDIRSAKVQTLGPTVVDAFYVVDASGAAVTDPAYLAEIERAVLFAVGLPPR